VEKASRDLLKPKLQHLTDETIFYNSNLYLFGILIWIIMRWGHLGGGENERSLFTNNKNKLNRYQHI
jgi:hypothetical protein